MIDGNQEESISRVMQIPWKDRILTKALFQFMAISLLPLLLVGTTTLYYIGWNAKQKAENGLLVSTAELARQVENYFVLLSEDIEFIASHFDRENLDSEDNIRFLSAFAATHHDIQILWLADKAGEYSILYSRDEMLKKTAPSFDIQPAPGKDDQKIVWYGTRYNTFGEPVITGSSPIMSPWEERPAGLLFFGIRPQSLQELFKNIDIGGKGVAILVDESGHLVSHSDRTIFTTGQDMASHPEVGLLQNEHSDNSKPCLRLYLGVSGKKILSAFQKIEPIGWDVIVEQDELEVYKTRNQLIWLGTGYFFALCLLVIPLAIVFSKQLTAPLTKLFNTIKEQTSGNLAARSDVAIPNEIGALATSFNKMADVRQKTEEALRESEQKLTTHLQNTPIGALSWDLNFNTVEWNPAAEDIFGYTKEEALGKHVTELILPEDMKELVNDIFQDLISEKGGERSINENTTKDGRRILCDWYNTTLKDADGKVIGVASLVQDITESRQAKEELEKYREHLEELVKDRTAELKEKNAELERMNDLFVGREFRIKELRDRVEELELKIEYYERKIKAMEVLKLSTV